MANHPCPRGLQARGKRTWRAVAKDRTLTPTELLLLEEGCRLADRLDRLHGLLEGDTAAWGWIRTYDGDDKPAELVMNGALAEARQHATVLRQILRSLADIEPAAGATPVGQGAKPAEQEDPASDVVDELSAARAARRAEAKAL